MDELAHKKDFKPINIKDLFMDKNPAVARWIPGFVYRLFSRIRNKHFVITFGTPIPYDTFDKRFSPKEWAKLVRDHTYLIPDDPLMKFSYIHKENSPP